MVGSAVSAPRVLPQKQAAHFCRLLVCDEGKVYPLSVYAQHLTAMLCGDFQYGGYTAEQVFTGLIFFYDDWQQEPMPFSNGQGRMLLEELHSGRTLRIFPHAGNGAVSWYAPTDSVPVTVGVEHRKYIHEVFSRLNARVQAGEWENVDAFIDKMVRYQCQFSNEPESSFPCGWAPVALFLFFLVVFFCYLLRK